MVLLAAKAAVIISKATTLNSVGDTSIADTDSQVVTMGQL
jgi:hypothetical protein